MADPPDRSHAVQSFRIEPDPTRRQPLRRMEAGPAVVRFMLDRSSESATGDESTQDFLVIESTPSGLCFAVTDGVGSSFLGELAAQFLAGRLVDWLSALPDIPGESRLAAELTGALYKFAEEAGERIKTWPIPGQATGMVHDVLEQRRAYGSEAMFACGRVDLTRRGAARVGLAWLGDARLRVLTRRDGQQDFSGQTADRWSTNRGPRGAVRSWVRPAADVERVIGCSDGLISALDAAVELADDELEDAVVALAGRPDSDDMALVDVALAVTAMPPQRGTRNRRGKDSWSQSGGGGPAAPTAEMPAAETTPHTARSGNTVPVPELCQPEEPRDTAEDIEPPAGTRWWLADRGYELRWEAVKDADTYTVQLAENQGFENPVTYRVDRTRFVAPTLGPRTWIRLRAHCGDRSGPWSERLELTSEVSGTIADQQPLADERPERAADGRDPLPSPALSIKLWYKVNAYRPRLSLRWAAPTAVDGAYVLSVDDMYDSRPARETIVYSSRFDLDLPPGRYRVRVRAVGPQQESLLSPLIDVRISSE